MQCRFDLTSPSGTLHLAEQPLGSFLEVFRDVRLIDEVDIQSRRLSSLRAPRSLRLADCTSQRARGFGLTGEVHVTEDYDRTQRWAAALAGAGYHGIRYYLRHDPSLRLVGVAVFGQTAASRRWRKPRIGSIDEHLLQQARRRFGVRVLPVP
jgi:RES domain-containing protein